jgi:hypothetical protein
MKKIISTLVFILCIIGVSNILSAQTITPKMWAEASKDEIQKMDWNDWLKLDGDHRLPAFGQLKPEQQRSFWLQKIEDASKLDWDAASLAHIHKLLDAINTNNNWFMAKTDEEREVMQGELSAFFNGWAKFAMTELNWSNKLIYALVMDLGKVTDKEGNLDVIINRGSCSVGR